MTRFTTSAFRFYVVFPLITFVVMDIVSGYALSSMYMSFDYAGFGHLLLRMD
ncbi:MAG: hypothetical protein RLZZ234_711 [Candidatus Parcubacteria bacterium]|jgi:hypothetical protein